MEKFRKENDQRKKKIVKATFANRKLFNKILFSLNNLEKSAIAVMRE